MASPVTIRELPPEEWDTLRPLLAQFDQPVPPSDTTRVVVAEQAGEIVGWWSAIQVVHLEPIWIRPDLRDRTIAYRMWEALLAILDQCRVKAAFCFSDTPEIDGYLTRLGLQPCKDFKIFLYEAERESALCLSPPLSVPAPPSDRRI